MKNNFITKIIGATLAFAMMIGGAVGINAAKQAKPVHAETTVTFTPGTDTGATSVEKNGVTVTLTTMNNASYYQIYASNSGTFSVAAGNITSIQFTCTASGTTKYGPGNASADVGNYDYSGSTGTWTGSASSVTISTTAQIRMTGLTVTYDGNGGGGGGDTPDPTEFTVSFNANGGSGTMSSVPNVSGNYTLPANGFTAPSGKVFTGWKANNAGNLIEVGDTYNVTANVTFYAQWENRYTVSYNANGGSGTITDSNSPYVPNATVNVMSNAGFTAPHVDMLFDRWNTAANGSGTYYDPGDTFEINANTTLYAQWVVDSNIPYINSYSTGFESGESFAASTTYNSTVDNGPSGKQWHIYYGTTSTNSPIDESQSLQMRWYGSAPSNHPYAQTSFASTEVKTISFNYKVDNKNMDFKVQYRENSNDEWTDIETVDTNDTSVHTYRHVFGSSIASFYFRVEVCGTAPTGDKTKWGFFIDSVAFKSIATPATINGNSTVKVGSQWSPTSITVDNGGATVAGATYSFVANGATIMSSNTSTGAFTCSSEGTVTVKATKSGYLIADKVVTVQPADAFVNNLSKTSVEAYTGQHETITFSYGGLDTITMESNDESVVTYQDLSYSTGSGSVRLNYVGAGSTTVLFKDGSTPLATITVSVENSTVTISGLPSSKSLYVGRTFNLGQTISVTHTGTYTDNVTWNSDNNAVASVTSAGVVTANAAGSANITVASVSAPSVTMTCAVTVVAAPKAFIIDFGNVKNTNPSDLTTATFLSTFSVDSKVSCTAVTKVCATDNTNMLKMGSNSSNSSITLQIPSVFYVTKVEAEVYEGNSNVDLQVKSGATESETESQNVATAGTYIFDEYLSTERSSVVTISTNYSKAIYLTSLILHYEDRVNNVKTQTKLSYHYNGTVEDGFEFTNISIRFGGLVSKALWDELDTDEHLISGFGIMIASGDLIGESELIKNNVNGATPDTANPAPSIEEGDLIDYYMSKAEMATPVEQGNNYVWNLFQRVEYANRTDVFVAAAYIKVGDEYVFLEQVRYSVESLAADYLANRNCDASTADGSLAVLANQQA